MHNKHKHQNTIDLYRQRMGFSATQVARLMGHSDASTFSDYERGNRLPSLKNALRLGIILRVPLEFLFGRLYEQLHAEIRTKEDSFAATDGSELRSNIHRI